MSRAKILLAIGIWTAILPYLGFPLGLKNILFSLTGFSVIYISYTMYLEYKKASPSKDKLPDSFSENHEFNKTEKKVSDAETI